MGRNISNNNGAGDLTQTVIIDFKVSGGGSVKAGSGKIIATALESIFTSPEITKLTQLNVTLNPDSIKNLQKDLETQLKSIGSLTVGVTAKVTGVDTSGATIAVPATVVASGVSSGGITPIASDAPKKAPLYQSKTGSASLGRMSQIKRVTEHIEDLRAEIYHAEQELEDLYSGLKRGTNTQSEIDDKTEELRVFNNELQKAISLKNELMSTSKRYTVARGAIEAGLSGDKLLEEERRTDLAGVIRSWQNARASRTLTAGDALRTSNTSDDISSTSQRIELLSRVSPTLSGTEKHIAGIKNDLAELSKYTTPEEIKEYERLLGLSEHYADLSERPSFRDPVFMYEYGLFAGSPTFSGEAFLKNHYGSGNRYLMSVSGANRVIEQALNASPSVSSNISRVFAENLEKQANKVLSDAVSRGLPKETLSSIKSKAGTLKDYEQLQRKQAEEIALSTFSPKVLRNYTARSKEYEELLTQREFDAAHAESAQAILNRAKRNWTQAAQNKEAGDAKLDELVVSGASPEQISAQRALNSELQKELASRKLIVDEADKQLVDARGAYDATEKQIKIVEGKLRGYEKRFNNKTEEVLAGRKEGRFEDEANTDYANKYGKTAEKIAASKEKEADAIKKTTQAKREESAVSDREAPPEYNAGIPEGYLETADAINKETQSILENQQVKQSDSTAGSETTASTSAEANAHNQNADALNNEASAREQNETTKQQQESNDTAYSHILDQITAKQKKYANVLGETTTESQQLSAQWNQLTSQVQSQSISTEEAQTQLKRLSASTKEYADSVRRANNEQTQLSGIMVKARMYYDQYANTIGRNKQLSQSWDTYFDSIRNGTYTAQEARRELNSLLIASKDAGVEVRRLGNRIKESFLHRIGFTLSSMTFGAVIGSLRKIYKNVTDIDAAMTQLRIITQQTEGAYEAFGDKVAGIAKDIGRSVTDVISSAETWARLGYSLSESATLAGATGVFANVAAVSESEATTSLTSVLKAYNYTADDAMHIVDILTQVGQKYAISASELGTALTKGGAALATAGNTLEESVALMAAGNAAVQNAETVGTALKTTTLRVAGSKAELEEMGEDVDDLASSTSKMRKEILALSGVDIMKDANTYKSTYQILKEIAAVWDKMDNVSQMALLEDLAGKRNASVIASVINNIKDLEGAYNDASNAAGTAERAQSIYMDSIEGKQARLTAQFQEFSMEILDTDIVKGIYDIGYAFVWLITQVSKLNVLLPTLLASLGMMIAMRKQAAMEQSATNIANTMVMGYGRLDPDSSVYNEQIRQYSTALAELNPRLRERVMYELQLNEAQKQAIVAANELNATDNVTKLNQGAITVATTQRIVAESGLDAAQQKEILTEHGLTDATAILNKEKRRAIELSLLQKAAELQASDPKLAARYLALAEAIGAAGASGGKAAGFFKSLGAALKTPMGMLTAIITVGYGVYKLISAIVVTQKEYIERAKEALKEAEDVKSKLEDVNNELDELILRRRKLMGLGEAATLEEQAELDIVNQRIEALERENAILQDQKKLKGQESYNKLLDAYGGKTYFDTGGSRDDVEFHGSRYTGDLGDRFLGWVMDGVFGGVEMNDYAAYDKSRRAGGYSRGDTGDLWAEAQKEAAEAIRDFDNYYNSWQSGDYILRGNLTSYANRPIISPEQMRAAGYSISGNDIATTYFGAADFTVGSIPVTVQWTPITDDGEVLSSESVASYLNGIFSESGDMLEALNNDKVENGGLGIIAAYSFGNYEDTKQYWEDFNNHLSDAKTRHAEAVQKINELRVSMQDVPNLYRAIYGDWGLWAGEDDMTDKLSKENDALKEREELISGLEALGYKYNKNATTEADKEFNNILKETRLRRDMWMIASGDAEGYRRILEDLVEFEILPMDQIEDFLDKMSDPEWQKTEEGANTIAYFAAMLKGFGFEIDNFLGRPSAKKIVNILSTFTKEATAGASAIQTEIDKLKELDSLRSDINAIAKAQKEMADTGYLSYDTYKKLFDLRLNNYIVKTANGYKLASGAMQGYVDAQRKVLASEAAVAKAAFDKARAMVTSATLANGIINLTIGQATAYSNLKKAYEEAQAALDNFDLFVKMFQCDASGSSSKSTEDAFLKQWEDVNNAMKHEVEMGKRTQASYMEWLRTTTTRGVAGSYLNANAELYEKYKDKIWSVQEEIRKYDLEQLDKQKDAFESLIDFRIKMLEEETKKQKEELDKRKDDLEDFYDKQIEMLEDQFDEEDYLEEQAEKRKELADMRREMEMLQRDDSAWAKKKLAEVEDEYAKAEKEYREWETEKARDKVKKTIEDERDAAIQAIEDAQEALDKQSEDAAALRRQAVEDILSGNKSVMDAMEQFSIKLGSWLDDNIVDKWQLAQEGVVKYGRSVAALNALFGVDKDSDAYRFWMEIASGSYQKHAAGTPNAHGGWAVTQENGPEAILRRAGGLFTLLNPGDKVLNADATNFLYAFANNPGAILASSMSSLLSRNSLTPAYAGMSGNSTINIDTGDVIIQGNADEKTVSEFRREKRKLVNEILQEFKKLR